MFNVTTRSGEVLETFVTKEQAEVHMEKLLNEDSTWDMVNLYIEDTNEFWPLTKTRLNRGGYDSYGRYFGTGIPLYCMTNPHNGNDWFFRGNSREEVLNEIKKVVPHARVRGMGALTNRLKKEIHRKGLEAIAQAKAYQDSAKAYPFKIVGRYNGGNLEEIDSFETFEAANTMLAKYRKDFGDSWTLAIPG